MLSRSCSFFSFDVSGRHLGYESELQYSCLVDAIATAATATRCLFLAEALPSVAALSESVESVC